MGRLINKAVVAKFTPQVANLDLLFDETSDSEDSFASSDEEQTENHDLDQDVHQLGVFVPKSAVLAIGKVEFESGDEQECEDADDEESVHPFLTPRADPKASGKSSSCSEVAFEDLVSGQIKTASLPVSLKSLLNLLPEDLWESNVLSAKDKQWLAKLLPKLTHWQGFSDEEATSANLRCLFGGDNFFFGNPIEQLDQEIRDGKRTTRTVVQRKIYKAEQKIKFRRHKERVFESLVADIHKHRNDFLCDQPSSDSLDALRNLRKRTRGEYETPRFMLTREAFQDRLVTEQNSLFLGIKKVLTQTGSVKQTSAKVWQALDKSISDRLSTDAEKNVLGLLCPQEFVTSALMFLSNPCGSMKTANDTLDASIWATQFVEMDAETKAFGWRQPGNNQKQQSQQQENLMLLALEQFFTAHTQSNGLVLGEKSTAVTCATRRLAKMKRWEQLEALRGQSSEFAELEMQAADNTSSLLKAALLPCHSEYPWGLARFHPQELERYNHPDRAFIFHSSTEDQKCFVGPVFQLARGPDESRLLNKATPQQVTLLNLVYDAVARLPHGYGTRADIRNLVRHSQFLRSDVPEDLFAKEVALAVDTLSKMSSMSARRAPTTASGGGGHSSGQEVEENEHAVVSEASAYFELFFHGGKCVWIYQATSLCEEATTRAVESRSDHTNSPVSPQSSTSVPRNHHSPRSATDSSSPSAAATKHKSPLSISSLLH